MSTGDPHGYGMCWCGINHSQVDWQNGYEAGKRSQCSHGDLMDIVIRAVQEGKNRANDLRWCNKRDRCHIMAEGADLVLEDMLEIFKEAGHII
jgi:hypothetical protein